MSKKTFYKKKEVKKKKQKKELPHYYRIITAFSPFYYYVLCAFLGVLAVFFISLIIILSAHYAKIKKERVEVLERLAYAQEIIKNHPDQPGAYYSAGLFAIQIKDFETAKEYLRQALFLNPEMSGVKKVLQQIEQRN